MFYPNCPKCAGPVESAEPADFEKRSAVGQRWLMAQRMTGHRHPYLQAAALAITAGRELYKRVPGGGAKRCTNPECGHRFN